MSVKEKATAPVPSVGADGKQSLCKTNKESIADLPDKIGRASCRERVYIRV